jgi:hypothetical protein
MTWWLAIVVVTLYYFNIAQVVVCCVIIIYAIVAIELNDCCFTIGNKNYSTTNNYNNVRANCAIFLFLTKLFKLVQASAHFLG